MATTRRHGPGVASVVRRIARVRQRLGWRAVFSGLGGLAREVRGLGSHRLLGLDGCLAIDGEEIYFESGHRREPLFAVAALASR